jgi:phytoene dehydrogenase-like protein
VADFDALVIGAGPNGLVAGAALARAGCSVAVLEARAEPGGAVRSAELTLPGYVHDVGAAFFPFGRVSPAFRELDLEGAGLRWCRAAIDSAHPAPDGTCASIAGDHDELRFGGLEEDAREWQAIAEWHAATRDRLLDLLLSELPPLGATLRFGPLNLLKLAEIALSSGRRWSERHFRSEAARRVIPGLALHTDIAPDDPCGAALGFILGALASSSGFVVPEGGTGAITRALVTRLEEAGGTIEAGVHVDAIVTKGGEAVAVRTKQGEISARRAIVADVAAPALYLRLLAASAVPARVRRAMQRFPHGFGTFKVDWALSGPVPWRHPDAARAAVVHAGDSLDDLQRFADEVRRGAIPRRPYLVIGQQSLADPSRAPQGGHTLWTYSRVPARVPGGWQSARERFADDIEARIEELAPGFRERVLGRHILAPPDLEAINENLIGGDLAGGSARIEHQLFFRPVFPYFRYRTPVRRLYLGSSYTHPGAGVHGACGRNAARVALRAMG